MPCTDDSHAVARESARGSGVGLEDDDDDGRRFDIFEGWAHWVAFGEKRVFNALVEGGFLVGLGVLVLKRGGNEPRVWRCMRECYRLLSPTTRR